VLSIARGGHILAHLQVIRELCDVDGTFIGDSVYERLSGSPEGDVDNCVVAKLVITAQFII